MNILYVYADSPQEWNCSEWNCVIPAKAVNRTGKHQAKLIYVDDFVRNTPETQNICQEADIIIVERNYFMDVNTIIQYWKSRNKTVIAIFDDAYDIMHPQNISYRFWNYGETKLKNSEGKEITEKLVPPPLTQFKWGLRLVKGIQVPSINLAKDWGKYNYTYYVHNYLDLEKYQTVTEPMYPHDGLIIGWAGSMSHYSSFTDSGVLDALKKIVKKYPDVTVLISGDKRIYDQLETKKKIFQTYVPYEKWASLLKTIDIGLAPLSGEYDKRRSWIKALEYMALKIPWIGTNYETYSELKDYGFLVENGYKGWEEAISEVIENHPQYKALAEKEAYEFALEQTSDKNIEKVNIALYEKLINMPYPEWYPKELPLDKK